MKFISFARYFVEKVKRAGMRLPFQPPRQPVSPHQPTPARISPRNAAQRFYSSTVTFAIVCGSIGLSRLSHATAAMASATSMPSMTLPNAA